ncbi:hypothetical protein B0H14DRAFT_3883886 [Mycena olivaceomarginata]|nr:hypothetical protein B0H14DRAFT_3883886 [Mycena olivaceomarginata]
MSSAPDADAVLVRKDLSPLRPSTSTQQGPSVVAHKLDWGTTRQSSRLAAASQALFPAAPGLRPRLSSSCMRCRLHIDPRRAAVVTTPPAPRRCLQCADCMLESRRRLKLNTRHCSTPPAPFTSLRLSDRSCAFRPQHARCNTSARSLSVAITGLALTSASSACGPPLGPAVSLSLLLLLPPLLRFDILHLPHFWSHFSLPAPPLVTNPLRNRVDSPMPAGVVCPCALPVQTRVRPPDLSHTTVRATRLAALHPATLRAIVPESSFSLMYDTNVIAVLPMYDPDEDSLSSFPTSTDDSDLSTRET